LGVTIESPPEYMKNPLEAIVETSISEKLSPPGTPASSYAPSVATIPSSTNPCSAFYTHPTTRTSLEQLNTRSGSHVRVYEEDLEAGRRSGSGPCKVESRVWGRQVCREKKCQRKWNLWSKFSKKQKLLVKVILAMVVLGAMVGLGVGIAKAVGGGVWQSQNNQHPIGG
jgi:hypothetical protein